MDGSGGHLRVCLPPKSKTYYWSLNPEGTERLSEESEEQLSLPHIRFQAAVCGGQWSQDDYDLVTQFHLNKGFDPYSQHFAIELDYPLVDINRLITIMVREQKQEAEEHREFPALHWSIVSQDDPYLPRTTKGGLNNTVRVGSANSSTARLNSNVVNVKY
ncbi:hypothetical protein B0H13DRAFT_1879383 [Mycena leptocephala]|nr:hypothetical protein B0H13DRAFT_1879383 [Mycena leptocephala]